MGETFYIIYTYPHSNAAHVLAKEDGSPMCVCKERLGQLVGLALHMVDNNLIKEYRVVKTVEV